jgi:CRISPR system Cascade subunit CasA
MTGFNLLTENWIPVQKQGQFETISLKRLLCNDEDWHICLSRDDMEMAALQLTVCIVQVVFMPDDEDDLREAFSKPMKEVDYQKGILPFMEWFDLLHPEYPFMQCTDVKASKIKSPQTLLTGLPEKTSTSASSHKFFNDIEDVDMLDLNIATVALFNRALNAPSEGGGFKGSLRGGAPATTLIVSESLRQTIWCNILTKETIQTHYPNFEAKHEKDLPTWMNPIVPQSEFYSYQIGFRRGLFWQPAKIKLAVEGSKVIGMSSEKMTYQLKDEPEHRWLHPHSPKKWSLGKDGRKETYLSFTTTAPAWTQLTNILIKEDMDKEGHEPSLVIKQYRDLFRGRSLHLIIGGYRNNQAKIEQRRHEVLSISQGWDNNSGQENIKYLISLSLNYKNELRNKLYGVAKNIGGENGVVGLSDKGQDLFYQQSESLIHSYISQMDWQQADHKISTFKSSLNILCRSIFDQLMLPYEHDPKFLSYIVVSRARLNGALKKIGEN